jgi:hypothetical protein
VNWTSAAAPSSLLALASVLHLGFALVRKQRGGLRSWLHPVLLPSFLFAAVPWVFASPRQLAIGLGGHLIWFLVAQLLVPAPKPAVRPALRVASPAPTAAAPASAPTPTRPSGFVTIATVHIGLAIYFGHSFPRY